MAEPPVVPAADSGRSRRRFLEAAAKVLAGLVAAVGAVPLAASVIGPIFRRPAAHFARVGRVDAFPLGEPVNPTFEYRTDDAYLHTIVLHDVWLVRRSATEVTVFSAVCPHLGCHYYWHAKARQFICPCHASVFSIEGRVLAGPSPRPLDTLPARIEEGELLVKWQRFELGMSRKVPL